MNQFSNNTNDTNNTNKSYDLEERTAVFSENIIGFIKNVNKNDINRSMLQQLIRSATSIGANYCEDNASSSKKDFRNKIYICKKEANETKYWLRILVKSNPELKDQIRELWKEAHEFHLIFQKITNTLNKDKKE